MALQTIAYNHLIEGPTGESTCEVLEQNELPELLAAVEGPDTLNPNRPRKSSKLLPARRTGK